MFIVYDKTTKQILSYGISATYNFTHEHNCPDPNHTSRACVTIPNNLEIANNSYRYRVDDSTNPPTIQLMKNKKIVLATTSELIGPNRYRHNKELPITVTITFQDQDQALLMPVGTLRCRPSRGLVTPREFVLTGSLSQVTTTWVPPVETIDLDFRVDFTTTDIEWEPRLVSKPKIIVELY